MSEKKKARIFYFRLPEDWTRQQKYAFLDEKQSIYNIEWQEITPDAKNNWLTDGMHDEFETFLPLGNKETKGNDKNETAIFSNYSRGVETAKDDWLYNFNESMLIENVNLLIDTYNEQLHKWQEKKRPFSELDSFVLYDDKKIKWSSSLKQSLNAGIKVEFQESALRQSLYRPFTKQCLYFDETLVHRCGQMKFIFPKTFCETENIALSVNGVGSNKPFQVLAVPTFVSLDFLEKTQCFPFYIYNEDGTNRRENITDFALAKFREHYQDASIEKRDIFHYVYGILHSPIYREKYAANLKRELPRIPFAPDFQAFAEAGKRLAEIHVNYETQPEFKLELVENENAEFTFEVEKMRLSKDKTEIVYNDFLTLKGIPPAAFEYRLGNRSALDWIIDQYQISTDKRSGISNNPNRATDEKYILRLIGQVITVSLETAEIVKGLPK